MNIFVYAQDESSKRNMAQQMMNELISDDLQRVQVFNEQKVIKCFGQRPIEQKASTKA